MPTDAYQQLLSLGYRPQQERMHRSVVVVKEKGVVYRLLLTPLCNVSVFQVDGIIIKEGNKCDYLVLVEAMESYGVKTIEVFVELKGKDILHAIDQLEQTLNNAVFRNVLVNDKKARVVGTGSLPSSKNNPYIEKIRARFFKKAVSIILCKCENRIQVSFPISVFCFQI